MSSNIKQMLIVRFKLVSSITITIVNVMPKFGLYLTIIIYNH
jgi:hypothetical protein